MPDVGMRVVLEAQVQQASQAINGFAADISNLANTAQRSAGSITTSINDIVSNSRDLNRLSPISAAAAAGVTNLANAVRTGRATFVSLASITAVNVSNINSLTAAVNAEDAALRRLAPTSAAVAAGVTNLAAAVNSGKISFVRGTNNVNTLAIASTALSRSFNLAADSTNRLSPNTATASAGITNLAAAVNAGRAALVGFNSAAGATANATQRLSQAGTGLVRPVVNANGALLGFNNIIRDAPYGIVGVGNNITQLVDAFQQLQRQTGSTTGALSALGGAIFSPAGLFTLGLSTAISLWTVYSQSQQRAASAAKKSAQEIKTLAQINADAATAIEQNVAAAAAEVTALNSLFAAARDETKSRQERVNALKTLQAQTNGYLNSLTLETAQTEAARRSLDAYNQSLFDSALAKAYQGQIDDLAKSYAQNREKAEQATKALDAFDAAVGRYKKSIADQTIPGKELLNISQRDVENSKRRNELVLIANKYIKLQNDLYDEILKKGVSLAGLQAKINPFKNTETVATGETLASVMKTLTEDMKVVNAQADLTGQSFDGLAISQVGVLTKAFESLIRLGLDPGSAAVENITDQINALNGTILGTTPILGKIAPILPVAEVAVPKVNGIDQAGAIFSEKIKARKAALEKEIQGFTKDINEIVTEATTGGVVSLSDSIGAALSKGGGLQGVLQSFVGVIADFGAKLGKQLIVQGIAIEAFKTSLASLQGVGAIAAGVALVAASAAFRALASKGVNSYATGGIVTTPQLALIGDNPGRKEAVIPSEMFDKLGGGIQNMELSTRIRGNDLYVLMNRAGREFNRFN